MDDMSQRRALLRAWTILLLFPIWNLVVILLYRLQPPITRTFSVTLLLQRFRTLLMSTQKNPMFPRHLVFSVHYINFS